jgi:MFS family permease
MAFVAAGRMIARYGPARVIVLGAAAFGAGVAWWALAVEVHPNYVSGLLGGMLLAGIGVGLALPTMMSTASSSLPPSLFATGSAVINMIRQTGFGPRHCGAGSRLGHPRRPPPADPCFMCSATAGG